MRTITFHRNLNATNGNTWTYKPNGYAVQATTLVAHNVTIKQPSGKSFEQCVKGGNRSVFAWFKTKDITADVDIDVLNIVDSLGHVHYGLRPDFKRIRFNPKNGDRFFNIDGRKIDSLLMVVCLSNGECYGIEH